MWNEPGLTVLAKDDKIAVTGAVPPQGVVAVARIDGAAARDADDLFGQFSDALRFPAYFGWNWDALSDCLRDLNWLPADRYLVVIEEPAKLLSGDAEGRRILFGILGQASREWASPLGKPGNAGIPFQTVLLADAADVEELRRELST
jgi:RNAse (barnase) inhibitor barstar